MNINVINKSITIRDAIKKMDVSDTEFLILIDNKKNVVGVFTSGDFRNAVLTGIDIEESVIVIANKNFTYLDDHYDDFSALTLFKNNSKITAIPILKKNKLVKILFRDKFILNTNKKNLKSKYLNLDVIIMAGGKGKRLDPFTRILPKPLMPYGSEAIINQVINNFRDFKPKFYISVFEKKEMIKAYLLQTSKKYKISFLDEKKPLGTAGSLKLLQNKIIKKFFFVCNCDISISCDYNDIIDFHLKGSYDLTIIGSMQHFSVPYGVLKIKNGGDLVSIKEKPHHDYLVNTGLYILNKNLINLIPNNKYFDMTQLIDKAIKLNMKIGVFPISEKSWLDFGNLRTFENKIQ